MPQLDPSTWFQTFLLTWLTLFLLMKKITQTNFPAKPKNCPQKTKTTPWTWPW